MQTPSWRILSITEGPHLHSFDCGVQDLNEYLRRYAAQNHRKDLGRTFVLVPAEGAPLALAYHTLCMAQVSFQTLPESLRKSLPRYPVPAVRLARLAVDRKWQSKGLGEILLVDAIFRALAASRSVAAKFMVVDALNENAESFYLRYGFQPFGDGPRSLIASLATLKNFF